MRIRLSVMLLCFGLAACSSQGTSSGTNGTVDVGNGCKINAAQICANVRGKEVNMSGVTADQRMVEQNSGHTADIFVPIRMPDGSAIVEVHCGINTQKQSVVYAQVKAGPPLTDERAKYLRAQGYCADS